MFCYDHIDNKTMLRKPIVHPIKIGLIVEISPTGDIFDENQLADINLQNTGYDYRSCNFACIPGRNWFKRRG